MTFFISVSYDGTNYFGFQRQKDKKTVQNTIESFLSKVFKSNIEIKGASRTDRFVHANDQRFIFNLDLDIDEKEMQNILSKLPADIKINWVKKGFEGHVRYDVLEKEYIYKIKKSYSIFDRNYYLFVKDLNVKKVKKACHILSGNHDFKSFTPEKEDTIRNIKINLVKKSRLEYWITLKSTGFKRYMCRMIVSAIINFSMGILSEDHLKKLIYEPESNLHEKKAFAGALYLNKITYSLEKKH